ncbi:MAG: hypothetical protein ACK56I_08055, partial [bacterium]
MRPLSAISTSGLRKCVSSVSPIRLKRRRARSPSTAMATACRATSRSVPPRNGVARPRRGTSMRMRSISATVQSLTRSQ